MLPHAGEARGFARTYLTGDAIGGLVMLSSMLVEAPARYWVWALALLVLMATPVFAVRAYQGQAFDARHVPERYGLFTIIVLGESVIAVAASLGDVRLDGGAIGSALLGFAIAAAIWWSYFETVSSTSLSRDRMLDSFLWGYGHLFGFAGIAATAIGVELAIEAGAAGDHGLSLATRLMLCGGVAAFLVSLGAVHLAEHGSGDRGMTQRAIAILALLVLAAVGRGWPPALMVGMTFVVLVVSVVLDLARARRHGPGRRPRARRRWSATDAVAARRHTPTTGPRARTRVPSPTRRAARTPRPRGSGHARDAAPSGSRAPRRPAGPGSSPRMLHHLRARRAAGAARRGSPARRGAAMRSSRSSCSARERAALTLVARGAVGARELVQPVEQRAGVAHVAAHRRVGPALAVAVEPQVQLDELAHVVDRRRVG